MNPAVTANANPAPNANGSKLIAGSEQEIPTAMQPSGPLAHTTLMGANVSRDLMPENKPGEAVSTPAAKPDRVESVIVGIVLFVLATVPLLTFLFSFGNVGDLGTSLGVDWRIAYLTGPGVDLTATGMIVAATWLSHQGRTERELWRVHALSVICALIMFGLNCGPAIYVRRFQLAAFNAVGPFLLMAMGFVGPWLLRQLTEAKALPSAADGGAPAGRQDDPAAAPRQEAPASGGSPAPARRAPGSAAAAGNGRTASAAPASGKPKPEKWATLALPLWQAYVKKHGENPTAPVLVKLLRNAHPDLSVPGSERSERNIRAGVEALLAKPPTAPAADADEEPGRDRAAV